MTQGRAAPDLSAARAAFVARLAALGFDTLPQHEIERLWNAHRQQLRISAELDVGLSAQDESALIFAPSGSGTP